MRAKYFKIQELVSRGVYEKYGERAWAFMDKNGVIGIFLNTNKLSKIITIIDDINNKIKVDIKEKC